MVWVLFNRQLSILPGRFQPSTFDVWGLNYCVRDGNRWIPPAIATGYFVEGRNPQNFTEEKTNEYFCLNLHVSACSLKETRASSLFSRLLCVNSTL